MTNILKQNEEISTTIEKQIGSRPLVSYDNTNGHVTITVHFEQLSNEQITIAQLQSLVRQSVVLHLEKEPQTLYVTINVPLDNKSTKESAQPLYK